MLTTSIEYYKTESDKKTTKEKTTGTRTGQRGRGTSNSIGTNQRTDLVVAAVLRHDPAPSKYENVILVDTNR